MRKRKALSYLTQRKAVESSPMKMEQELSTLFLEYERKKKEKDDLNSIKKGPNDVQVFFLILSVGLTF